MLARVTGRIESLTVDAPPRAVIAPLGSGDGLGYEVLLPAYLAQRLLAETGNVTMGAETGPVVTLHTIQYFESLNQGTSFIPRLIGFDSPMELQFFELLTSVKGLGNKRALRALATSPGAVARAIVERDARFLQGLPEIGPKLADLIVHELKSKAEAFLALSATPRASTAASTEATTKPAKPVKRLTLKPEGQPSAMVEPRPSRTVLTEPAASPPIRETVSALVALGESPIDAERMVSRAVEKARSNGDAVPTTAGELLTLAYASR